MGFSSLYDFRFLYKPLGVPNNEWSSLQWLFGGIITAVYIYSENKIIKGIALLSGAIILCLALVSFSRGIYLAGIVFIILLIGRYLFGFSYYAVGIQSHFHEVFFLFLLNKGKQQLLLTNNSLHQ